MDEHLQFTEQKRLERVKTALEKNNMAAYVVATAAEVPALVQTLLPAGASVCTGGSMTLNECGVTGLLRSGAYTYHDQNAETATPESKEAAYLAAFTADVYLASANAVTENGEIYQMDGRSNRVAAILWGPKSVVLVVGRNKIVADVEAARQRNARVAAPANAHRLQRATPCATTGVCINCASEQRICANELVMHRQLAKHRVKVILVSEDLGY